MRDASSPVSMIYMRHENSVLKAQPGTNDSMMERPTCREVKKMPILSKVNSMGCPSLGMWAVLVLVSCGLGGQALAQEPGTRDRIYVVTHADLLGSNLPAGKKLLQQYVADSRKEKGCVRIE